MSRTITCKAAVCWAANEELKIEEIQVAPPQKNEVRAKVVATGLCFSDVAGAMGKVHNDFPIVLGHEGTGIVESVGEGVTHLKPGDSIMFLFLAQCKNCRVCKEGVGNVCSEFLTVEMKGLMADGTSRFLCRGQQLYSFIGTSTFTEYTVVSVANCTQINPSAPLDKVCILSCGIPTGYGGAVNSANVRAGSTCAVFGLGAIGLATVMGCRDKGASRIIAVDINSSKFELAKELGATECVNPKELSIPIDQYFQKEFNGGLDYTFECVGLIETMMQAWNSTVLGHGVCVQIGVAPKDQPLPVLPVHLQLGRTLMGSVYGGYKSRDEAPNLVEMYMDGKLNLDKFITHRMTLDRINEAIELLKSGGCIRTVIKIE